MPTNAMVGDIVETVKVKELSGPNIASVEITFNISNTNDPPYLEEIDNIVVKQDHWVNVNITATDDDGIHEPEILEDIEFSNNLSFAIFGIKPLENYFFTTKHEPGSKEWVVTFQFYPDNSMVGKYRIYFAVQDEERDFMDREINLTVQNVNDPPDTPTITSPISTKYRKFDPVFFKGQCNDKDIGISGVDEVLNFTWTSSLHTEPLGYGSDISTTELAEGDHTITLKVTDTGGENSTKKIMLTIDPLFTINPDNAEQSFGDEALDLLLFTSEDGVKFKSEFSTQYPAVDIQALSSEIRGTEMVIKIEMKGSIKNATGYYYYVYIVNSSHAATQMVLTGENLPDRYEPPESKIYHKFKYEGGRGFVQTVTFGEGFQIVESNIMEFSIQVTYLEEIKKMPSNFGIFAVAKIELTAPNEYIFSYDSLGTGAQLAPEPPKYEKPSEDESMFEQPIVQAISAIIVLIIVVIVLLYVIKLRKERKELVAPASFDYKFVSGLGDTEQYESLYGTTSTQTQAPPMGPPMQPGMMPPPPMGGVPPGMQPGMRPGMPPGQPMPGLPPGAGTTCKNCGKAIVLGMTKCPHCNTKL
jgi:hypothetical protein